MLLLRNHTERITIWNLISLRSAQKPIKAPLYSAAFYMNILWKCSTVWSQQRRVVCIWYTNICISKPKMNIRWKRYDMWWRRWSKPRKRKEKMWKFPPLDSKLHADICLCVKSVFFAWQTRELAFSIRLSLWLFFTLCCCSVWCARQNPTCTTSMMRKKPSRLAILRLGAKEISVNHVSKHLRFTNSLMNI